MKEEFEFTLNKNQSFGIKKLSTGQVSLFHANGFPVCGWLFHDPNCRKIIGAFDDITEPGTYIREIEIS